jgi:mannose-6-phosphate isomerase-like protein (cupin superfamily)
MQRHALTDVLADTPDDAVDFTEVVRERSLSVGVYTVPAGATDPQDPHTEDEVYYVVSGRATVEVDGERAPAEPGDVVYVDRGVDHRFLDVEEDLVALVVFAPPEGSLAEG